MGLGQYGKLVWLCYEDGGIVLEFWTCWVSDAVGQRMASDVLHNETMLSFFSRRRPMLLAGDSPAQRQCADLACNAWSLTKNAAAEMSSRGRRAGYNGGLLLSSDRDLPSRNGEVLD